MNIKEIIKDSLIYPLTNWKSYLILGIIFLIINLYSYIWSFNPDIGFSNILLIAEFVTGFLSLGYLIKIIKSTLDYENILPNFNGWLNIIVNGFKGSLIIIAYSIPFLILMFLVIVYFLITNRGLNSNDIFGLMNLIFSLYTIVIIPIIALALANMAFDEGRLLSAFSFGKILDDIHEIGWGDLIVLYLLVGIIYIIFKAIPIALTYLLSWIDPIFVTIIKSLILIPYLYIFATRTVVLVYRSSVVKT